MPITMKYSLYSFNAQICFGEIYAKYVSPQKLFCRKYELSYNVLDLTKLKTWGPLIHSVTTETFKSLQDILTHCWRAYK